MNVKCCSKICNSCGFLKGGIQNTLYAEAVEMMIEHHIFPCHLYLKAHTGSESYGTETLKDVEVCRGYVAFTKFYLNPYLGLFSKAWDKLFEEIKPEEIDLIYNPKELYQNHKALREGTYLGNKIEKHITL